MLIIRFIQVIPRVYSNIDTENMDDYCSMDRFKTMKKKISIGNIKYICILIIYIVWFQIAGGEQAHLVTYPYFMAITSLLNQMELVKQIFKSAAGVSQSIELTKGMFTYYMLFYDFFIQGIYLVGLILDKTMLFTVIIYIRLYLKMSAF